MAVNAIATASLLMALSPDFLRSLAQRMLSVAAVADIDNVLFRRGLAVHSPPARAFLFNDRHGSQVGSLSGSCEMPHRVASRWH
jgi:hypothetical protein